ncbi:twin-arginine translocase TatA/TatE family subunit [Geodermatophilus chilensis]|uniref:twin-arginine translocase TatA/TatE family subunit n=1 Tax=Geodermatophilus chilensis TaxID=2035835 RepID=UPI000C257746|nr:twin-arginine translocase TatA/TatE family subunit [Geodermatophilus chilensis]
MFSSIGWGEIIVLALAALFVFGPDRLPDLARESAAGLQRVRSAVTGVRGRLEEELGDDLGRLGDLRQYHPRTLVREHLLGDDTQSGRAG